MLSKKSEFLLFVVVIFFSSLSFIKTLKDVNQFGAIDLRDKIVGARLLSAGLSPYFYKWENGDDERFLDPLDGFNIKITRVAVPPSLLFFLVPLSKLNYETIKWIWFFLSYLCFILILLQFQNLISSERKSFVWLTGLFFFICAMAWHMHIERGQVYIFYAFILSSAYWSYRKEKYLLAGILFALLCWLRLPFLITMPLVLLLPERKKLFTGFLSSAFFLLLISFLFIGFENWKDYFSSIHEWSKFEIHEMTNLPAVKPEIPSVIEGETNLGCMRDFLQNNRSVQCIAFQLLNVKLYAAQLVGIFSLVILLFSSFIFFKWRKHKFIFTHKKVFIFIFLLYILTEYFSPAPSYSYHYVQWIFPVLLCLSSGNFKFSLASVLMFLGLAMNLGVMSFVPYNLAIGEGILFAGTFLYCIRGEEA